MYLFWRQCGRVRLPEKPELAARRTGNRAGRLGAFRPVRRRCRWQGCCLVGTAVESASDAPKREHSKANGYLGTDKIEAKVGVGLGVSVNVVGNVLFAVP